MCLCNVVGSAPLCNPLLATATNSNRCANPDTPLHGKLDPIQPQLGNLNEANAVYNYSCAKGYQLISRNKGDEQPTYCDKGHWTKAAPICRSKGYFIDLKIKFNELFVLCH